MAGKKNASKSVSVLFSYKLLVIALTLLVLLFAILLLKNKAKHSSSKPGIFFTQNAPEGSFIPQQDSEDTYLLTLSNVPGTVHFVSDSPTRYYGVLPVQQLVNFWSGQFASDPPNASLVAYDGQMQPRTYTLELLEATFDSQSTTTRYKARLLSGGQPIKTFKDASLFIDPLISLTFINNSNDANTSQVVIFQK